MISGLGGPAFGPGPSAAETWKVNIVAATAASNPTVVLRMIKDS